jgi:hypothetical protein
MTTLFRVLHILSFAGTYVYRWRTNAVREDQQKIQIKKDNFKIDLKEIGWENGKWFYRRNDRDQWRDPVFTVTKLRVP